MTGAIWGQEGAWCLTVMERYIYKESYGSLINFLILDLGSIII